MNTMKKILSKVKSIIARCYLNEIATFIIGWIILFDTIGGTFIPIAYGHGSGWFAIPNLLIDIWVIYKFVTSIKENDCTN